MLTPLADRLMPRGHTQSDRRIARPLSAEDRRRFMRYVGSY